MYIDKNKVNSAIVYMITRNPFKMLFAFLINGMVLVMCTFDYIRANVFYWIFLAVTLLWDIYNIIIILIIKSNCMKNKIDKTIVSHPRARLLIRVMRGNQDVCVGYGVSGFINGKYKNLYCYQSSLIADLKEKVKAINELEEYECDVVKGSKLIFDFTYNEKAHKEIVKLENPDVYLSLSGNESIKAKYKYLEFDVDEIINYLNKTNEDEELYILNLNNRFVLIKKFFDVEKDKHYYSINADDIELNDLKSFLDDNGFIFDNKIRVFYTYDKNSPVLLENWLKDLH